MQQGIFSRLARGGGVNGVCRGPAASRARARLNYRPVRKSFRLASEAAFSVGSRPRADQDDKTASSSFRDDAEAPYWGQRLAIGLKNPCSIPSPSEPNIALRSDRGQFR